MSASRWYSLLLAVLALSTAAHAQTTFDTYRLTRIGVETFGIFDPVVSDINENGEMAATTGNELTTPERALLLRDGMAIELGDLMGGASPTTQARAINDLTQITGVSVAKLGLPFGSSALCDRVPRGRYRSPDARAAADVPRAPDVQHFARLIGAEDRAAD